MRIGRPVSLILSLALMVSAIGQVTAYAAETEDASPAPGTSSEAPIPGEDDAGLPADDSDDPDAPAPEDTPEADEPDAEPPAGDDPLPPFGEGVELAPAWAAPDPDQGALARSVGLVDGEETLALAYSYQLEETLTVRAGAVLTLTSATGTLSRLSRAPQAEAGPLIEVEAGATLILKDIVLDGGAAGTPTADGGALVAVYGTLRLENGAVLCDNGLSSAAWIAAGGKASMAGGEVLNCGFATGYAVENLGEFTMTGGAIWYDERDAGGNSLYGNAVLNSGQLDIGEKSAIFGNNGVVNSGTFRLSGGTLTGTVTQAGAPAGTGVANSGQFEQAGGTVQAFALGVENSGAYTLTGGAITGNTASGTRSKGGGIRNTGALAISGGAVKGNSAGHGGEIYSTAGITLSGKPVIGTDKTGGIYLAEGSGGTYPIITVTTALAKGSVIALEDSEHRGETTSRHILRRNITGAAATFTAAELGYIFCCSSSRQLKYDAERALYYLAGGTLQDTINDAAKGSAASPVVIYLAHNTPIDQTVKIASGTTARNIKLVGGSLVRDDGASPFGGVMLHVPAGSTLTLDGVEINGGLEAGGATGALVHNAGTLTLTGGSLLHGNALADPTGAAGVENNATFKMTGGTISGNTGIAVLNRRADDLTAKPALTLSGGAISGNTGTGGGGVVCLGDTTFTMSGGAIFGNTALRQPAEDGLYGSGGGVYSAGTFKMTGGTISGNEADDYGGGVYLNQGTMALSGGQIEDNTTGGSGGGIYGYGAAITMSGGGVLGNSAYQGGGYFLEGYGMIKDMDPDVPIGKFTLSGGTIAGNTADFKGGGVMNSDSILVISGGTITGNTAEKFGGGVYNLRDPEYHPNSEYRKKLSTRTFEMKGGTISANRAAAGGGVFNEGVFTLGKGTLSGNEANFGGGVYGLHNPNFQITVSGGAISANRAVEEPLCAWNGDAPADMEPYGSGGGILSHGPLTISGGTVSGNEAVALGGGVLSRGHLRLTGGTIKSNTATTGRDIFAGAVESGSHAAGFELRGKPVVGSKTEAGGLWLGAPAGATEHVCINVTGALASGCFVRFEGSGAVDKYTGDGSELSDEAWDKIFVVLVKDSGNLTAAELKMFFCGPLERELALTSYSHRKLQMTKVSGTLQARVDAATGGTAKKPVVLTLTQSHALDETLAVGKAGAARHITLTGAGVVLSREAKLTGAMVTVAENSTLNLADITLDGAHAGGPTGPTVENAGTLTLKAGALLRGGVSSGSGGAVQNSGTLLMQGGAIAGNTAAANGGGIHNTGHFEMTGGDISGNHAQNGGGAAGSGTFVLQGGAVTGNTAEFSGGGLWLDAAASFTLSGARIGAGGAGNVAALSGGGVYSAGTVALKGGAVAHNEAARGGGLYLSGSLTLTGGSVGRNTATGSGGGLYQSGGTLLADGTAHFEDNTAGENGGGLYVDGAAFSFGGGSVVDNTAEAAGGGLYLASSGGQRAALGGSFEGNFAARGGGVYAAGQGGSALPLTLSGAAFTGNTAQNGAGLYLADADAALFGVQMTGGEAAQNGGGLYLKDGKAALYSGSVAGNHAGNNGGGIYAEAGSFSVHGGEITENLAQNGGGIYSGAAAATAIYSGRILRNGDENTSLGGGALVAGGGALHGGTLQGNRAAAGADLALLPGHTFAASGSPVAGGHGGGISTAGAPLLLDGPLLGGAALVMEATDPGHTVAEGSGGYLPTLADTLFFSATGEAIGFEVSGDAHNSIKTTQVHAQTGLYVYYNHENGTTLASDELVPGGTHQVLAALAGSDAKTGYTAAFWIDGARHYRPGDTITVTKTLVLAPVWAPRTYTVEYYWDAGSGAEPYPAGAQQNAEDPAANPTRHVYGRAGALVPPLLLPEETAFTGWALYNGAPSGTPGPTLADLSQLTAADLTAWADDEGGVIRLLLVTTDDTGATGPATPTITGDGPLTLRPGDTHRLAAGGAGVFWFSTDPSVATVDQNGLVTAKKSGSAGICVAAPGGYGYSEVGVRVRSAQPLAFQGTAGATQILTLQQGGTADLPALLLFDGEPLQNLGNFSFAGAESCNKASAPVDENGLLTAERACTTTLTVTVKDSSFGPAQTVKSLLTVRILPDTAKLTTLAVSPAEKELLPGKAQKLTASVGKAQLQSLVWEVVSEKAQSGAPGEAVVALDTAKNTVTAQNPGTAVLRCTATDLLGSPPLTATCTIRVVQRATSVAIFERGAAAAQTTYNLRFDSTASLELEARLAPANTSNTAVTWKSSNTKVAIVDADTGVVTAGTKTGTATITATAADGSKKKHSVKVAVGVPVSRITLAAASRNITLNLGGTHAIKVSELHGVGEAAPTNKALLYEVVGGGGAVTVSGKGVLKAVGLPADGQPVTVRVTPAVPYDDSATETITVTVKAPLTALKVDQKAFTLQGGRTARLSATLNSGGPVGATELRWTSANPAVLAVNSRTGRLTAMPVSANTKVAVTVTDAVSGRSASVSVTVSNKAQVDATGLGFTAKSQPPATLAVGKTWKPALTFTPSNTTNKNVTWEVTEGGQYIQLNASAGTIKALSVDPAAPQNTFVELVATGAGGTASTGPVRIQIVQPVTALKMSQTKATLQTGNSLALSAAASPAGAGNPAVTWKSSNTKVATVSESGLVTAHKGGSATITATAADGSKKSATAKITVRQRVEDVSFVKTGGELTKTLAAGGSFTLKASFNTGGQGAPYNKALTWASSDPAIATVSAKGAVKALAPTQAGQPVTITATSADNPAAVATCTLTVTPLTVTRVAIAQGNLTVADDYAAGNGITLTATLTPDKARLGTADRAVTWQSSAPAVATVTADPADPTRALLHPVGTGTATITASAGGKTGTITVTVSAGATKVTGLSLSRNSTFLGMNKSVTLKAAPAPSGANVRGVEWQIVESYDANGNPAEGIATVSTAGKVTARAQGTVVVQARSLDGGHTAACTVYCVVNP